MGRRIVTAQSVGGPLGASSGWECMDETIIVALQATLGATVVITPISIVTGASGSVPGGMPSGDNLAAGSAIATLEGGVLISIGATLALQAAQAVGLIVLRAAAIVGGTLAFGWRATAAYSATVLGQAAVPLGGDAGTPAFTASTVITMPAVAANTALVTPTGGSSGIAAAAYLPVQPGDLVALVQGMQTGTLATPALAAAARIV